MAACGRGIMNAERSLYLRIPVSALAAESLALKSAGGCHGRLRPWHNERRAVIMPLWLKYSAIV